MNIARLNINVGGIASTGFEGDAREFRELEQLVGGALPKDYLELVRQADGGHPEIGCYQLEAASGGGDLFDLDCLYALANPAVENVKDVYVRWAPVLGNGVLPLGRDGGGNQVYVLLNEKPATVWLYRHENGQKIKLASSIEAFVDALMPNPDFI